MPSTPPPVSLRARTPPSPQHADTYEPYSPRRSKRSTAHSNPYSSFNGERSPKFNLQHSTPPPTTVKKARFARAPPQLSSPPSSPASPAKQLHGTPKRQTPYSQRKGVNAGPSGAQSDSDNPSRAKPNTTSAHLGLPNIDPITMLPTPSKTPKKRTAAAIASTARVLNFQPLHPNDVMPSPRKLNKKQHARSLSSTMPGFELYEDDYSTAENKKGGGDENIEIYTDANARVPEMDLSEDNPFVGTKTRTRVEFPVPQQRRGRGGRKKSEQEVQHEQRIEDAVRREEGVTYVFRGKKIFRRFQDSNDDDNVDQDSAEDAGDSTASPANGLSNTLEQRRLKRQAGVAAQRPLTRSAIKPRLLFPSEEQQRERERGTDDADEEAVTDIEMGNARPSAQANDEEDVITPVKDQFAHSKHLATPPSTIRAARGKKKATSAHAVGGTTPIPEEDEAEPMSIGTDQSYAVGQAGGGRRKGRSPFDAWQRTKSGRKRAGEAIVDEGMSGGGKRTRSGAATGGSPM